MDENILYTIKKLIGIEYDYTIYDMDLTIAINSAIGTLTQIGVGPAEGFVVSTGNELWSDLIGDTKLLEFVKQYVYLKVKTIFDPSQINSVTTAYDNQIKELEWRISVTVDKGYALEKEVEEAEGDDNE